MHRTICLQAQASKLVADTAARSEGYNLTGFLREVGLPAASSAPPAGAQDFALIKREGLKSAAAAAKHGDSSFPHKACLQVAAAPVHAELWLGPVRRYAHPYMGQLQVKLGLTPVGNLLPQARMLFKRQWLLRLSRLLRSGPGPKLSMILNLPAPTGLLVAEVLGR